MQVNTEQIRIRYFNDHDFVYVTNKATSVFQDISNRCHRTALT